MKHLTKIASNHKKLIAVFIMVGMTWNFLQSFSARYFQKVVDHFTNGTLTIVNIFIYGAALIIMYLFGYIFSYPWENTKQRVSVVDPTYGQKHEATIYRVSIGDKVVSFAAAEFSNCVYGFYIEENS